MSIFDEELMELLKFEKDVKCIIEQQQEQEQEYIVQYYIWFLNFLF